MVSALSNLHSLSKAVRQVAEIYSSSRGLLVSYSRFFEYRLRDIICGWGAKFDDENKKFVTKHREVIYTQKERAINVCDALLFRAKQKALGIAL
jgi:hypothetical protein